MTNNEIKQVCITYSIRLRGLGWGPVRAQPNKVPTFGAGSLQHAHWMIQQIPRLLDWGDTMGVEKAHRWLGFAQGILWCHGTYTIEELRDHNNGNMQLPARDVATMIRESPPGSDSPVLQEALAQLAERVARLEADK